MEMGWCYGLMKEKDKLVLIEVYFDKKTHLPFGYYYVGKKDKLSKSDKEMIKNDLVSQLSTELIWEPKHFKNKALKQIQKMIKNISV